MSEELAISHGGTTEQTLGNNVGTWIYTFCYNKFQYEGWTLKNTKRKRLNTNVFGLLVRYKLLSTMSNVCVGEWDE